MTPSLLATAGTDPSALRFTIDARNAKASRRRRNPDLIYGTFPFVVISGDNHQPVALHAVRLVAVAAQRAGPSYALPRQAASTEPRARLTGWVRIESANQSKVGQNS